MDSKTPTPVPPVQQTTPESTPPASHTKAIIPAVVLLILIAVVSGMYATGYMPSFRQSATTPTPTVLGTSSGVAWQALTVDQPTKVLISSKTEEQTDGKEYYATSTYNVYPIGTFTEGPYVGSKLYIANETYPEAEQDKFFAYFYYVGDATGNPVAWWGREGTFFYGMGDFFFPESLNKLPAQATSTMPGLSFADNRVTDSSGAGIAVSNDLLLPSSLGTLTSIGSTVEGGEIVKTPAKPVSDILGNLQKNDFYSKTPFGALHPLTLLANFIDKDSYKIPPHITWSGGSTAVAQYNYGEHLYGVSDCFADFTDTASLEASLIQTGVTANGDPLYEVNPVGHDATYQCLYKKSARYSYDPKGGTSAPSYPMTYAVFLKAHPVFFWKHQYGEWLTFGRNDVVPAAEKGKPVIYLYPTGTQEVSVQVDPIGGFTKTDPAYGSGWSVTATPESVLTNMADGKVYPYLFWEGGAEGVVSTPKEGFVVAQADVEATLEEKLTQFGLNQKEREDFMEFWVPKLSHAPFYFITFISRSEIDRVSPMTITPAPDTTIRVLMDYKPLNAPIAVDPLHIVPTARKGFTVVEWGGIFR